MVFTVKAALIGACVAGLAAVALHAVQTSPAAQKNTARITGRVTQSDTGAFVKGATVQLAPTNENPVHRDGTDDNGVFDFTDLPAGEYRLTVVAEGLASADSTIRNPGGLGRLIAVRDGQLVAKADVVLGPRSIIEGRVLDQAGVPVPGVAVSLNEVRYLSTGGGVLFSLPNGPKSEPTNATGAYRFVDLFPGDYYIRADASPSSSQVPPPSSTPFPAPTDSHLGYAATYFPGTDSTFDARAVHLELGRSAFDTTFALVTKSVVRVAGVVKDEAGQPLPARVMLIRTEGGEIRSETIKQASSDARGAFSLTSVLGGYYVVQAFCSPRFPGDLPRFGSLKLTVSAIEDLGGITVVVHPAISARGRLKFDSGPPPDAKLVSVDFTPTDFLSGPAGGIRPPFTLNDDWTFEIGNLASIGLLSVRAPAGWRMKSVTLEGVDIADTPHDFQSADVNGLVIVVTNHLSSIGGTVSDGLTPTPATVVMFADDSTKWRLNSRLTTTTRASASGEFTIAGLLPGRYRVIAVPASGVLTPERLAELRPFATAVDVAEGASLNVPLKLISK